MRKIPTIYVRDWDGTLGPRGRLVTRERHPDCGWVFDGEGTPTRKLDGTAALVADGRLYKRLAVREGNVQPDGFIPLDWEGDDGSRKLIGWVPVGDGPEDRWHREARDAAGELAPGTYELVGPRVQGNPEEFAAHALVAHADPSLILDGVPTDYDELRDYLAGGGIEGVVWHHPDWRMAKIKAKDLGVGRS